MTKKTHFSIILALLGFTLALIVAPAAQAQSVTIGEVAAPSVKGGGGCGNCIAFQLQNAPGSASYSVPPGQWTLESWSGQGGAKEGSVRLEVFRPGAEPGQYLLIAQSPFVTVPAGALSTFAAAIPVEGGDVVGVMTGIGSGYSPSYVTPDVNDIELGVSGIPQVGDLVGPGSAHATSTFGAHRANVAATLTRPDPVIAPAPSPTPAPGPVQTLSVLPEGNGTIASTSGELHCPDACAAAFPVGTGMTLVATPGPRAEFVGWTGACSGIDPNCNLTVDRELQANAKFVPGHDFTLGKVKRHRGHTSQAAKLENPGTVRVVGKGIVAATVAAKKGGTVKLPLAARGATLSKLEASGIAKALVRVTYTPDGGRPKKVTETVTLHG